MDPIELLRAALSDPALTEDDLIDLSLYIMTDGTFLENEEQVLQALVEEGYDEEVATFRPVLEKAKEIREDPDKTLEFYNSRQDPDIEKKAMQAIGGATGVGLAGATALAPGAAAGLAGRAAMGGSNMAAKALKRALFGKEGQSAGMAWLKRLIVSGGVGWGVDSWLGADDVDADPGTGSDHNAASPDPSVPPEGFRGDTVIITDPQTGQTREINVGDVDPAATTGLSPEELGGEISLGPGFSAAAEAQAMIDQGQTSTQPQGQFLGRNALGRATVQEPMTLPSLVGPSFSSNIGGPPSAGPLRGGRSIREQALNPMAVERAMPEFSQARATGANLFEQTFGTSPDALLSRRGGTRESPWGTPQPDGPAIGLEIPEGAQLAPRAFMQATNGKRLIDIAREVAGKYGVPLNILYGMVEAESNWNPNAQGDEVNGTPTSFGLVQIHLPVHQHITRTQAFDPVFALEFAAKNLKERHGRYGSWEAAVAAHNSPVAADYYAKTGQFYNAKSQKYTTTVMDYANQSGLSSQIFDFGGPGSGEGQGAVGMWAELAGPSSVFPVEGATLPGASQIGHPRDGGARQHQGLDIMAPEGTNVYSTVAGRVRYASNRGGKGGYAVSIEDAQGNYHYFAHLSPSSQGLWQSQGIVDGAQVQPGSLIGYVGSTGNASADAPHVHYSINEGRKDAPLIDPWDWLQNSNMNREPEFDPYYAPDPQVSRDYIQSLYAEIFNREPTEEERAQGHQTLTTLSRSEYNRQIREARGVAASGPIDPKQRFESGLMESGEAEFNQNRQSQRTFTDYAANIAQLLQRGL